MTDRPEPDHTLIDDWVRAGERHLDQVETLGSLVQHNLKQDEHTRTVCMTMRLPAPLAEAVCKQIQNIMDTTMTALVDAVNQLEDELEAEKATSATKH